MISRLPVRVRRRQELSATSSPFRWPLSLVTLDWRSMYFVRDIWDTSFSMLELWGVHSGSVQDELGRERIRHFRTNGTFISCSHHGHWLTRFVSNALIARLATSARFWKKKHAHTRHGQDGRRIAREPASYNCTKTPTALSWRVAAVLKQYPVHSNCFLAARNKRQRQ